MLAYYRNSLSHVFIHEAYIACSVLSSNGSQCTFDEAWEKVQYLKDLLSEEFIVRDRLRNKQEFIDTVNFMAKRKVINVTSEKVWIDIQNDEQTIAATFHANLVLPFIESYWMTLAYFAASENRQKLHDSDKVFSIIQWQTESLHEKKLVSFYEACMLESIKNAVKKFVQTGVIQIKTVQVKRTLFQTLYKLSEEFKEEKMLKQLHSSIISYQPHQSGTENDKVFDEIRKLTVSDFSINAKL